MLNELKLAYIAAKPFLGKFAIKLTRSIAEGVIFTVATKYTNRMVQEYTYSEEDKEYLENQKEVQKELMNNLSQIKVNNK